MGLRDRIKEIREKRKFEDHILKYHHIDKSGLKNINKVTLEDGSTVYVAEILKSQRGSKVNVDYTTEEEKKLTNMGFFSLKRPYIPEEDYYKGVATEVCDSRIFHASDGNFLSVTNHKLDDLVLSNGGRIVGRGTFWGFLESECLLHESDHGFHCNTHFKSDVFIVDNCEIANAFSDPRVANFMNKYVDVKEAGKVAERSGATQQKATNPSLMQQKRDQRV